MEVRAHLQRLLLADGNVPSTNLPRTVGLSVVNASQVATARSRGEPFLTLLLNVL